MVRSRVEVHSLTGLEFARPAVAIPPEDTKPDAAATRRAEAGLLVSPSVLVTGASSGIGAATARLLGERGFEVFGTSRDPDSLGAGRADLHWIAMDITSEDSVEKGVEAVLHSTPRIDALVCNAGTGIFGSVEEVTIEQAKAQFETNFFGTLRTLRAVVPHMRKAGSGRIAVIGSLARLAPIPFQAHYSATKSALDGLVQALRNELHPTGVCVSLVDPGDINTAFNDNTPFGNIGASPYAERIRRCEQVILDSLPKAPGPAVVAEVVHRALTARRPRVHYYAGPNSGSLPWLRRFVPDGLALRFIRRHFKV